MDVYFYEAFEEEQEALRESLPISIKAGFVKSTVQESGDFQPPARLISIRTQSRIPSEWKDSIDGVLSRSTGYDHLKSFLIASSNKVACGYLPLYCNRAVAEQAMLMWMALLRKLPTQIENFLSFKRDGLTGRECIGKTLLIVGVGNIGYEVVKIGIGLGMEVFGVDIVKKHSSVKYVSIEQGIGRADVIVCAMNLTEENRGYFDYDLLSRARPEAIFINVARGEMSPPTDLYRLLSERRIGGVGLDVYQDESRLAVSLRQKTKIVDDETRATLKLLEFPNVILTPHNAFNTREAVKRKSEHTVRQIAYFFENGSFLWPVPQE